MIPFRRFVQTLCLLLFLALLTLASFSGVSMVSLDLFLQMDPALVLISALSGRVLLLSFIPAALVLLSAPFMGRLFCGYVCPMGTTLDGTDSLFGPGKRKVRFSNPLFRIKYLVLAFLVGSALLGVSYVFFASPLSLITRFYGLLLFPVISFLSREGLDVIRPLGDILDISALSFAQIRTIRFATQFFILFFFIAVISMVAFSPRFWCRHLCPSGALLALLSRSPVIKRGVSDQCTGCGKCVRKCPMSAIAADDPLKTLHGECIVCRTCEAVCPEKAVSFKGSKVRDAVLPAPFYPERRNVIRTGIVGMGTAVLSLTGLYSVHGKPGEGQVGAPGLIRPPGAVPETEFLSRCVRCGECMVACPTNTLQPIGLMAGLPALFSPAVTPRRGFCDPRCQKCAEVCPTDAIRSVGQGDRIWAKIGTAEIIRQRCLAWEFNKSCMVCDEVCPYDAVQFRKEEGNDVPVPHVLENKCAGCGYCEYFCPVRNRSAITVTPMDALRIQKGDFEKAARQKGFTLQLRPLGQQGYPSKSHPEMPEGPAPGFDAETEGTTFLC